MTTIDDRAISWAENNREMYAAPVPCIMEISYYQGASEQQKIDSKKFSIAFCDHYCNEQKRLSCDAKGVTCTALNAFLKQAAAGVSCEPFDF